MQKNKIISLSEAGIHIPNKEMLSDMQPCKMNKHE